MKHLGEIAGIVVADAGGHIPQQQIGLIPQQLHGGLHPAAGKEGVEGGVAVFAEQAAQIGLGNADFVAHALHAQGVGVILFDIFHGVFV